MRLQLDFEPVAVGALLLAFDFDRGPFDHEFDHNFGGLARWRARHADADAASASASAAAGQGSDGRPAADPEPAEPASTAGPAGPRVSISSIQIWKKNWVVRTDPAEPQYWPDRRDEADWTTGAVPTACTDGAEEADRADRRQRVKNWSNVALYRPVRLSSAPGGPGGPGPHGPGPGAAAVDGITWVSVDGGGAEGAPHAIAGPDPAPWIEVWPLARTESERERASE